MNSLLLPMFTFSVSLGLCLACGSAEQSYRKVAENSLDAKPIQPVEFSFSLPARSNLGLDSNVLLQKMTGYAFRIEGQGEQCRDTNVHESYGAYEDSRTFAMELSGTCNYLVNVMVGELAPAKSELQLTATINYNDHIKPVIAQQCVSCHADYKDFSVVAANARSIISYVENESMPPKMPLDGSTIALFLAWGDEGYLESDPNPKVETAADTALKSVFYRNNTNDYIMSYELLGRSIFELRRSLWIQPDGEALGLANEQIYTFRTSLSGPGLH